MTRRIRDAQALFRGAKVARFISLPLGVAKVTAVGKAMHRVYLLGKSVIATNINYQNFADGYLQLKCF
jgi:hypothetical protein